MKLITLPKQTAALLGFNRKLTITYADIKTWTDATAQAVIPINDVASAALTMKAGTELSHFVAHVVTAFAGTTTLYMEIGYGGHSGHQFIGGSGHQELDLMSASDTWVAGTTNSSVAYLFAAADTVDATVTRTGAAITALSAGEVAIYFNQRDVSGMAKS